jgi:hypothetical protein
MRQLGLRDRPKMKGTRRKEANLAELLYWMTTAIAGLMVAAVIVGYVSDAAAGEPFIPIVALLAAGAIWLMGWMCRNMLRGR